MTLDDEVDRAFDRIIIHEDPQMTAPAPSQSQTDDTAAGSGVAGVGAQSRTAFAETTADIGQSENYVLNLKRMFDEFMAESLTDQRARRVLFERLSQNALTHDQNLNQLALQALSNAAETANMVGKQAVRHHDLAIDRTWNLDEIGSKVVLDNAALADMIKRTFGTTEMAEIVRGIVAEQLAKMNRP